MTRIWFILMILMALPTIIGAVEFSVLYDCSVPPAQSLPPWDIIGRCNYQLNVNAGILHTVDPDQCSWVLLERPDPRVGQDGYVSIEARVMVPTGGGYTASPQIAFTGLDPGLPYDNRAHMWYAVDLYPTGIGFTKVDNDKPEGRDFGFYPISDLNSTFHTIKLQKHEERGVRDFAVFVDGVAVFAVTNDVDPRPITAVDIGYGLEVAAGDSYWDYVRYWSESPIAVQSTTWGSIKSLYR